MDDAEYIFRQDCKEKKVTARSAHNKKRRTGCKLPSDYMSKKELRAMNGKEITMNLNKPMTYLFFKTMPVDLQQEYLRSLNERFNASAPDIADKFKIKRTALTSYMQKRKITFGRRLGKAKLKVQEWEAFWDNAPEETVEPEKVETETVSATCSQHMFMSMDPENPGVVDIGTAAKQMKDVVVKTREAQEEDRPLQDPSVSDGRTIDEVAVETPFELQTLQIQLKDVRDVESLLRALRGFSLPLHNKITINIYSLKEE